VLILSVVWLGAGLSELLSFNSFRRKSSTARKAKGIIDAKKTRSQTVTDQLRLCEE